ncbi:uncharacterized protein IAS62_000254 [Cryptococcus decagattii]|uniref:Uncharacterized protein n=1 Tax=Cryptococcus decagattii TaxID=1859122 RepID=A0ABZ2AP91_9TREE
MGEAPLGQTSFFGQSGIHYAIKLARSARGEQKKRDGPRLSQALLPQALSLIPYQVAAVLAIHHDSLHSSISRPPQPVVDCHSTSLYSHFLPLLF